MGNASQYRRTSHYAANPTLTHIAITVLLDVVFRRDVSNQPNQAYERYATKLAEIAKVQGADVILYMTSPETQNEDPVAEPMLLLPIVIRRWGDG